jgi:NAD(P)-dependent dehydrogenase (short-subunit alcohol dehydrogenase family)
MPRTALVTGGASGLGAASAARLRADGLTVTTLDLSGPGRRAGQLGRHRRRDWPGADLGARIPDSGSR